MHGGGNVVMLLSNLARHKFKGHHVAQKNTYNTRVQHTRLRVKRVDSGVDAKFSNTTRQDGGGVQVSKGCGRGGISQIIGRDIDGLDGSNRTFLSSSNTFLPAT